MNEPPSGGTIQTEERSCDMTARMTNELSPLMRLQDEMNEVIENLFEDALSARGYGAAYPGVNVWEDGDTAYIEAELPGISMDDVEVDVVGNEVTIAGERKTEAPAGGAVRRRERPAGRF